MDAKSGKLVWETQILDYHHGAKNSSGPIVADARSSRAAVASRRVPRGVRDHRLRREDRQRSLAPPHDSETRRARQRIVGQHPLRTALHVGMWMVPSYDPETKRLYVGTSVTAPAPKFMLGSNKNQYLYHNSTLALDINTGDMIWFFQHVVDHWDLDIHSNA